MTQYLLFLVLYVVGVAACLGAGLAGRPHLCGALGFVVGVAVMVVVELVCLGIGIPFTLATGVIAAGLVVAGGLAVARREMSGSTWKVLAAWLVGFAAVAWVLTRINLSLLTYDSHYMVLYARAIADDGAFAPEALQRVSSYGIFTTAKQVLVALTDKQFLWAFPPVFAASTVAAFVVILRDGLDALGMRARWRPLALALVALTTFSIYMMVRHAFYIQTNFGTGAYVLVYCGLFWTSEITKDTSRLPIAFLALVAVGLHRIEGPLIAAILAIATVLPSELPPRRVLAGLGAAAAAIAAWYLLLAAAATAKSPFMTPMRGVMMASVLVVVFAFAVAATRVRVLRALGQRAPMVLLAACGLAVIAAFALRFDHMAESTDGWMTSLFCDPVWQGAWIALLVIALAGVFAPALPSRGMFVSAIVANLALILLLVLARIPYYAGMGDSAARMAIHVVPLAFLYHALALLPLLDRK